MGATPSDQGSTLGDEPALDPAVEDAVREIVLQMIDLGTAGALPQGTIRQLAYQVEKGRRVSFYRSERDEPVVGYVSGWDPPSAKGPYYWFVLEPLDDEGRIEQHLIPWEGTRMVLHREETLVHEKQYTELDKILRSFRYSVIKNVLGKTNQSSRSQSGKRPERERTKNAGARECLQTSTTTS